MNHENERWISAESAVAWSPYQFVMLKKELSQKAKLSIYQSVYVPFLIRGHELLVMTKRIR